MDELDEELFAQFSEDALWLHEQMVIKPVSYTHLENLTPVGVIGAALGCLADASVEQSICLLYTSSINLNADFSASV